MKIDFNLKGFTVLAILHNGNRSILYKAIRKKDNLNVILKISSKTNPSEEEIRRINHDFTQGKRCNNKHIIKYHAIEPYEKSLAIIEEDFDGENLSSIIPPNGFHIDLFLKIAIQIAEGLDVIHKNHITHKDINPQNILINRKNTLVKLIDFGISSELSKEAKQAMSPVKIEGSLPFISPEQTGRMNRSIDYRTDFYSLGVTLYKMLTGRVPFDSTDPLEVIHGHIVKYPLSIHEIQPHVPAMISNIIQKLMAKIPEKRYQTCTGLIIDLNNCYKQWEEKGCIEDFELGKNDILDTFQIPEKLYGRESEINKLLSVFDYVANGNKELLLCSGVAGIGKTSLIREIHKPIVKKRGFFINGKYDLFTRNIPYTAIIQAFKQIINHLLTESEANLLLWKERIMEQVGVNGLIIIDIIPELIKIIGPQPAVQELPSVESQNRFNIIFRNFIKIFASENHPLVLFLDDMQWADNSSLKLIEVFLNDPELKYFLFICAYRDNEVDESHPFYLLLNKFQKEKMTCEEINLQPLKTTDINNLLSEALYCDSKSVLDLATLVQSKTAGNPFFTLEFLKTLYHENLITFNNGWTWDIAQINEAGVADNVIELMAAKIGNLSENTWEILKIAACIGFEFDIEILALVAEKTNDEIFADLLEAFNEGIIIKIEGEARFVHDKVGEAAHSLIDQEERQKIHYKIAQKLLSLKDQQDELIFNIADQLNFARSLLTESEKKIAIDKNIRAGHKAKSAVAYNAASDFYRNSAELLPQNSWEVDYEDTLVIYNAWSEVEYLATHYEKAEELFNIVLDNAKTEYDKLKVYHTMFIYFQGAVRFNEAIELGVKVLNDIGFIFPKAKSITKDDILTQLERFNNNLGTESIYNFKDLPLCEDKRIDEVIGIIYSFILPFWVVYPDALPYVLFEIVNLSIEFGLSSPTSVAFSALSAVFIDDFNNYDLGYEIGEVALEIQKRFGHNYFNAAVLFMFYNNICYWKKSIRWKYKNIIEEAYPLALETGNIQWGSYCINHYCMRKLLIGDNLEDVKTAYDTFTAPLYQLKQDDAINFFNPAKQAVYNLLGLSKDKLKLKSDFFDEEKQLQHYLSENQNDAAGLIYLFRLLVYCIYNEYSLSLDTIQEGGSYMGKERTQFQTYFCYFLMGITYLQNYNGGVDQEQQDLLQRAIEINKKFKSWSDASPESFSAMSLIVSAELARVQNDDLKAISLYSQAIESSEVNDFTHLKAIAHELAAKYWRGKENQHYASYHLRESYTAFKEWGAIQKVRDLELQYTDLENLKKEQQLLKKGNDCHESSFIKNEISELKTNKSDMLDMHTIIKASQTISMEIHLDKLLTSMMKIIIENTGAQKGYLIRKSEDKLYIKAMIDAESDTVSIYELFNLDQYNDISTAIINYVIRNKENIVLNDASNDERFSQDPYIQGREIKSILCIPFMYKERLYGVLYLENRRVPDVFTRERIELLQVLLTQAAISMDNADLYGRRLQVEAEIRKKNEELGAINEELNSTIEELEQTNEAFEAQNEQLLFAQKELIDSEERFRRLAENAKDVIYRMSIPDGVYEYISPASKEVFGYSPEEFYHNSLLIKDIIHQDWEEYFKIQWGNLIKGEMPPFYEYQINDKSGKLKWLYQRNVLVLNENGNAVAIEGIVTDITFLKESEEKIKRSLKEKEILLGEIHHRVKNNMQIISSLLSLQSDFVSNKKDRELFLESKNRVHSMALVHEKLYQSKDMAEINFREYIVDFIKEFLNMYPDSKNGIVISISENNIYVELGKAIPCALIINELVSNSLKYAFPRDNRGEIEINFIKDTNNYKIIVSDNGIGFPKDIDFLNTKTLGLKLVVGLTEQLNGTIELDRTNGTTFTVVFP